MQASIFDHPVLKRKLLTRSIVLEGRGGGSDGVGGEKDIKEVMTEVFTVVNNVDRWPTICL